MSQKSRIITLSVLSILIVICIVLGVTYSFMQANIDSNSVTKVSLSSCAKITLEDGGDAILLENSYPVSRNKGMQTDPYTFTVTSDCESYVGFNMYLATLNTNTLSDSSVHYVITEHGSKEALIEGILSEAEDALSEFSADEQNQINIGINGTFGTIYKLYNADIPLQGSVTYDLYLWVDESVTNDTMNQVFKAGVAIKSYDREAGPTLADYIINNVYVEDGVNGLYYHDSVESVDVLDIGPVFLESVAEASNFFEYFGTKYAEGYLIDDNLVTFVCGDETVPIGSSCIEETQFYFLGSLDLYLEFPEEYEFLLNSMGVEEMTIPAFESYDEIIAFLIEYQFIISESYAIGLDDKSYRFIGKEPDNYVCFGSNEVECPYDNLYRIIGIFDGQVKLIKADYASKELLGTDGGYSSNNIYFEDDYLGNMNISEVGFYDWGESNFLESDFFLINLNTNFLNYIGTEWSNRISNFKGCSKSFDYYYFDGISSYRVLPNDTVCTGSPFSDYKVGLLDISDYAFSVPKDYWYYDVSEDDWNYKYYAYTQNDNWLYLGNFEWLMNTLESGGDSYYYHSALARYVVGYDAKINSKPVRPVFYLNSDVRYVSGTGTEKDPYRIQ